MAIKDLVLGDIISFETIAPGIIPTKYNNVVFQGMVSANMARGVKDIVSLHKQIYPVLATTTNLTDDYRAYGYIGVLVNDKIDVVGIPWIRADSLVLAQAQDKRYTFPSLTPDAEAYLNAVLKGAGITNYRVETV